MKKWTVLFIASFMLFFSCNTQEENGAIDKPPTQNFAPSQMTRIADLPDSLQPKSVLLATRPKPLTVVVSPSEWVTKMLPVLCNEKGERIAGPDSKPFIMGRGGRSNFTNFTTDDGLASDVVSCSLMDKSGCLWFGTLGGGVSRYDGKAFTTFTTAQGLANNGVFCITQDKSDNLWFGTRGGGVSRYDGTSFRTFNTAQGLANDNVRSIAEDKHGNLWFATLGGGVSRYDGKAFTTFTTAQGLANNSVFRIIEDKTGILWFGTDGGGVSRYDGASFTTLTTAQGPANNTVWSIIEDRAGNLWFGTLGGGVSRFDGQSFTTFTTAQGLGNNSVFSIREDRAGNLWFGTLGGGVSRYDGKTFTTFSTAQGLANDVVFSIIEDHTGNLWFGTLGGGVSRYDGGVLTTFSTAQGLAGNLVLSIAEDSAGKLWFGALGGGISRYDGAGFTTYANTKKVLPKPGVWCILEDKAGALWLGTRGGGVSRYDGKGFTTFTTAQGLANNVVLSIAEDSAGNLWFGTEGGGASRFDGNSFTTFSTAQGLADNVVLSIRLDKTGALWFGTRGGGVSRYDGQIFTTFSTAQGLADNAIWSITEDRAGNLWFGGDGGGVSRLSHRHLEQLPENLNHAKAPGEIGFENFTTAQGLSNDVVYTIVEDKQGNMVLGTNLGFTIIPAKASALPFSEIKAQLEYCNPLYGYPIKDVNANAMLCDKTGSIWAGAGSEKTSLVRFDYAAMHKRTEPPTVMIQAVKVNDENICWHTLQSKGLRKNAQDSATSLLQEFLAYGKSLSPSQSDTLLKRFSSIQFDGIAKFYPVPKNLALPYEHNRISFEFATIETSRPSLVNYQYMLQGYDKNWSPITHRSSAGFGNIQEGEYTFHLKAQGANGIWSKPITFTFKVLPPWYRTWWAYLTYALFFLSALRIFSRWREGRLRVEKENLEKAVMDRTQEVVAEKKEVEKQRAEADNQRQRSDELLLNILPAEIAEELKAKGSADAKQFDSVTVMFTDFKDFTQTSERLTPAELVAQIDFYFKAFDGIITKFNLEKIKTIGDSYMCAGGLPVATKTHATDIVNAAIEIQQFMLIHLQQSRMQGKAPFELRIGVHTGPVIAGIVGVKKFAYDIWGNTVNIASRMESSGEAGKINISGSTHELVRHRFDCTHRGKIKAKNTGEIDMYFVKGAL